MRRTAGGWFVIATLKNFHRPLPLGPSYSHIRNLTTNLPQFSVSGSVLVFLASGIAHQQEDGGVFGGCMHDMRGLSWSHSGSTNMKIIPHT